MEIKRGFVINGKKTVLFILYFTIIMETLIAEFKLPTAIRYVNDIAIIILIYFMRGKILSFFKRNKMNLIISSISIFFIVCCFSALFNWVPIRLFFWAIRNTFRGIVFFIAAINYIDRNDIKKILDNLLKLQFINLILAIYQFAVLHHIMDRIGGIFGYGNGSGVNIFNAILIAYYLNNYLWNKNSLLKLLFAVLSSFIIAALAEEKMTYIIFMAIFIISIGLSKFSLKKIMALAVGTIGLFVGLILMKEYYPGMYEVMTNINRILDYAQTTYEEGYRLPRIGAFPKISELFFKNDLHNVLGLGFGNCDTSNFSMFQSDFYNEFGEYNYRLFTHQWIFIEGGYLSFISFVGIFICIAYYLIKGIFIEENKDIKCNCIVSFCLCCCCIILIWYNATLKNDMQYLAYFSMIFGFLEIKNNKIKSEEREKIDAKKDY